jgi:endoglucanase
MNAVARRVLLLALAMLPPACAGYSVRNGLVVDGQAAPLQLRGVNWFGAETTDHLVNGLWARNYRELIADVKSKGFNAVRLPICSGTLHGAPINPPSLNLTLNPELSGLDTMTVFDHIVAELDRQGFYILLDHHTADCKTITPLWTTADFSDAQWLDDLRLLAQRYRGVKHVIGIDLKNEPHDEATWGTGNIATDWNQAAERGAKVVLAEAPGWLIFVEGIQNNPICSSTEPHLWGENLEPLACTPLNIPPDRLVLAPHTYGPDVAPGIPAFSAPDYPRNLSANWERDFGRYQQQGYALVLGEFGGKYGDGDPRDKLWQDALVAYLNTKGIRGGFYWSLNPNSRDTGGLLLDDWTTWRSDKLALLQRLWSGTGAPPVIGPLLPPLPPPSPTQGAAPTAPASSAATPSSAPPAYAKVSTPTATITAVSSDARFVTSSSVDSDWGKGYCVRFTVRNTGSTAGDWQVEVPLDGSISSLWRGQWKQDGPTIHVHGEDYNRSLKPGESTDFGFCASRG